MNIIILTFFFFFYKDFNNINYNIKNLLYFNILIVTNLI